MIRYKLYYPDGLMYIFIDAEKMIVTETGQIAFYTAGELIGVFNCKMNAFKTSLKCV